MAMLMHTHGQQHRPIAARAHLSAIRRFSKGVVAVLAVATAVTAVMAVKTAYFLSQLSY
jgi:hypothetical protein